MKRSLCALGVWLAVMAQAEVLMPIIRPQEPQPDEKPVEIEQTQTVVADNGFYRFVETTLTFTNPNKRPIAGELDFPLPQGATVCGYWLEINGELVPGVVCEKAQARVAFENEVRKAVDPGLVEHVKGNIWRTRIHPLNPNTPRRAKIRVVTESPRKDGAPKVLVEKDGDEIFVAEYHGEPKVTRAEQLRQATSATIYWDASYSRHQKISADRALLESLPDEGDFTLVVFRNVIEPALKFQTKRDLLLAVDQLTYDGATCLDQVLARMKGANQFLFTDELDLDAPLCRKITVRKAQRNEPLPAKPLEGKLLATVWASHYITDRSANAVAHRQAFLKLGRRYGVASPVTSLIVLETLDQYLTHKIEPPTNLSFYAEWKRRRAAEDDPIAIRRAQAEHEQRLLALWEERVKWWKDPIPPKKKVSSGLFGSLVESVGVATRRTNRAVHSAPRAMEDSAVEVGMSAPAEAKLSGPNPTQPNAQGVATIEMAAWNPSTPYLKALDAGEVGTAYAIYLKQREKFGNSPAFYLDCANWFFKANERLLAVRILSNLAELRLEDSALWRVMGWRLREAGVYPEAIEVFRHIYSLRSEEPHAKRDLALVLTERAQSLIESNPKQAARDCQEALGLLHGAAFENHARRSARRSNDLQVSIVALEELNGLLSWISVQNWAGEKSPTPPKMDEAFRRDLPLALRIVLSWDADSTDVDLHVLEPDGEEAFYRNRRTPSGGFVSEDVTTGYGPEEYLRKTADRGKYQILAHYFASHQRSLLGPATVTATVYTGWGTATQKRQILTLRLDKPRDKHQVGVVTIGE